MDETAAGDEVHRRADEVTYADVLRHGIRRARLDRHLKPTQLAKRMATLGYPWHPQTVSNMESGRRRITAEELLGLAIALETPLGQLVSPVAHGVRVEYVQLPAGQRLLASMVRSIASLPMWPGWVRWDEADEPLMPRQEFMEEYARLDTEVTAARQRFEQALAARTSAPSDEARADAMAAMREAELHLSRLETEFQQLRTREESGGGQ